MRRRARLGGLAALMLAAPGAAALTAAAPALGARRPSPAERRALVSALQHAAATRHDQILLIRISTVAPGWAFARLRARDDAILRRHDGRWRVTLVGGVGLGCRVPYDVRRDFRLIC